VISTTVPSDNVGCVKGGSGPVRTSTVKRRLTGNTFVACQETGHKEKRRPDILLAGRAGAWGVLLKPEYLDRFLHHAQTDVAYNAHRTAWRARNGNTTWLDFTRDAPYTRYLAPFDKARGCGDSVRSSCFSLFWWVRRANKPKLELQTQADDTRNRSVDVKTGGQLI